MRFFEIAVVALLGAIPGAAQNFSENLAPKIPTPQVLVEKMLQTAELKPSDVVYDLGSGDGRIVITAARKYGVRAVGVELDPELCRTAKRKVKEAGLDDKVSIVQGNMMNVDLSPATVVTMYLLTSSNLRIKPNLEKYLKPGTRVISNDYPIKGWKVARWVLVQTGTAEHKIYVYEIGSTQ
jgi:ubiquinone/menaquinone biosynthesis C-methylase UbiE